MIIMAKLYTGSAIVTPVTGSTNAYKFEAEVIENSTNISNNTSNVTCNLYATGLNGYSYGSHWTPIAYINIDGNRKVTQQISSIGATKQLLCSWTGDIEHSADGTKAIRVTFNYSNEGDTSSYMPSNAKITASSVALTTIPRASSFTTSGNTIGSAVNVNITRASSSFTHTVTLKFSDITETKTNIGTSTSFTPNLATYASKIPNATSGTGTITVDTYNGSTKIGSVSQNITLNLPDSVKPTAPTISLTEAVSGLNAKFGAFIQSKSKINVSASASGAYGSTISAYKIEINGSVYNSSSAQTGFLTTSGTNTCTVTVTDSRGRTNTASTTFNVLAYTSPQITLFTAQRNASTETTINCVMSGSITSLNNKNDKSFKVTTSVSSGNKYNNTTDYSISNATCDITGATATNTYTVTFTVSDYFTTVTQTINVGTGSALMNFAADGKKMAIGQIYDTNIDVDLQVKSSINVGDAIYIGGTKIIWKE